MKDEKLKIPKKDLARIQLVEFGKILFNLQIVVALIFASPLPFVIYPIYYAALILISIFTGFAIFLAYPKFSSLWVPKRIYAITSSIIGAWKYTIPIVIAISLLSIFFLSLDKNNKHLKRIIASIIIIVLMIVYLIFRISILYNGGAA